MTLENRNRAQAMAEFPVTAERPFTILCVSSYEKGHDFLRAAKEQGCRVLLVTVEKLRDAKWPRESIDETFYVPENIPTQNLIHAVSYLARTEQIDRVAALDEFDMENVAALREHMRIPGVGLTTVRYFRDKLAMRGRAKEAGVLVPEFVHVLNYDALREYMGRVKPPWLLKPRSQASGIGMKKIHHPDELWPWLDQLGDQQSYYLLEQFVSGDVYHIDSVVSERELVFAAAHAYGRPPLDVSHEGGIFTTRTLPRESAESVTLHRINRELLQGLGFVRGVTHAEFLRSHEDGQFYFVEVAARVGGAHIADVVEAASGVNLWREYAHLEIIAGKKPYQLPPLHQDYAGAIISLARQEHPDTSAYNDPEIVFRVSKRHHAGFVFRSPSAERIRELIDTYVPRFREDFYASMPVPEKPSA